MIMNALATRPSPPLLKQRYSPLERGKLLKVNLFLETVLEKLDVLLHDFHVSGKLGKYLAVRIKFSGMNTKGCLNVTVLLRDKRNLITDIHNKNANLAYFFAKIRGLFLFQRFSRDHRTSVARIAAFIKPLPTNSSSLS